MEAAFAQGLAPEVFLQILEESPFAQQYGQIKALDIFASTLLLNTDCGPVAMVIWRLADRGNTLVHYEHPFDPLSPGAPRMLEKIESQMQLKVVMRDNRTGETTGFWLFENVFGMGEFAEMVAQVRPRGAVAPFAQRASALRAEYRFEDLIALTQQQEGRT
jgi:hypothetical protein